MKRDHWKKSVLSAALAVLVATHAGKRSGSASGRRRNGKANHGLFPAQAELAARSERDDHGRARLEDQGGKECHPGAFPRRSEAVCRDSDVGRRSLRGFRGDRGCHHRPVCRNCEEDHPGRAAYPRPEGRKGHDRRVLGLSVPLLCPGSQHSEGPGLEGVWRQGQAGLQELPTELPQVGAGRSNRQRVCAQTR